MTLLGLLVWGGVFVYGVMYAQPVISVDYRPRLVEMVKKKQGMPEGAENGWLVLRGLVEKSDAMNAEFVELSGRPDALEMLTIDVLYDPSHQVHGFDREEVIAANLRYMDHLKRAGFFEEANRLRAMPFAVRQSEEPRLMEMMLPEVGKARLLTRLNAARMHLAHQRGDDDERFEAFDQCLALSDLESRQGTMIEFLVGVAIRALAMSELRQEFIERPPTEAECMRAVEMLDRRTLGGMDTAMEGERMTQHDVVQVLFSDTGNGNGRLLLHRLSWLKEGSLAPPANPTGDWLEYKVCNLAGLFMPDRKENLARINGFFDPMVRQAAMSRQERLSDSFDPEAYFEETPRSYPVVHIMLPAVGKSLRAQDQIRLESVGTRLMILIELHRARTGAYPEARSDLVASVVPEVPLDPFTWKSFGYRRLAKGEGADGRAYLLYSYGGDEVDDGGKPAKVIWDALHSDKAAGTDFIINRPRPKPIPQPAEPGDME